MRKLVKLERVLKKTNMFDKVFRCGEYIGNSAFMVDESLTDIGRFIVSEECVKCINPDWSYHNMDDADSITKTKGARDGIAIEPANEWHATDACVNRHGKTWMRVFKQNASTNDCEELLLNEDYVKAFELQYVYANDSHSMCRDESGQILVMPYRF